MISKILIANRGEIAIRVARTCRIIGIKTVAIFSEADKDSPHVFEADDAVFVGDSEPTSSYLNMEKIISIAKETGAQAIHPGYGFLSENSEFSRLCEAHGIVFIGPPHHVLKRSGDKIEARRLISENGIKIIPGMISPSIDPEELLSHAETVGYPLIIKAVSGGGGKGMRVIKCEDELKEAIPLSISEARKAFGDGRIYLEKYFERPRHIEFQILADKYGNILHLYERECSVQRRYQKLVEETPSTALDDKLRAEMADTAIQVAKAVGYVGAGTIEFLLERNKEFYFLEINARLQVEHPVTEFTTGIDIVKKQIEIAMGEPLNISQEDIYQRGHAIECRIYAEDPEKGFAPSPGKILFLREPSAPGVRIDSGICEGFEVPVYYDPILSKVIAWGEDRISAIEKMKSALKDYPIMGIKTTAPFLLDLINTQEFADGELHIRFIEENFKDWHLPSDDLLIPALAYLGDEFLFRETVKSDANKSVFLSPWDTLGPWRI